MSLLSCAQVYWEFTGQCTQCGHCTDACESLIAADMTLGEIAKALLAAQRGATTPEELAERIAENPRLVQAVRGCFFCTQCKNTCFAHNDVTKLIYHARVDFQNLGLIPRDSWSSVQVDQEWDVFTAYRAVYGIGFADLTRHLPGEGLSGATDCEIALMPGCSLAAYAPELTREIFTTVEQLGGKATLIDLCCGSPLKSAGFYARAEALCDRIASELQSSGARQLVCVCPGCVNEMRQTLARHALDIKTVSLAAFLAEHSFSPTQEVPREQLWLSKSCQDRDGDYLEQTCAALGIDATTPAIFNGCCGAGGAVSAFSLDRQEKQTDSKLSFCPDGATVVTMCPTCTYTYAFYLLNNPRPVTNKHYTELLFVNQFDWQQVFGQLEGMWSGEYGPWLAQVLG
ncbi:MAG: (Fe-S)-binding protein [Coriobacteriales bacterium]|jgi:Fe-S oxidoreductase|nr:(Fe-S)-binding protein [Coriobacteriales bacterium]